MSKTLRALFLLVTIAGTTACEAEPAPADGPPSAPSSAAVAPSPTAAPSAADCGTHDLGHRSDLPAATLACFLDAVRGHRPAVLRVTRLTVEGDPVFFTYTVLLDGTVDVVTDHRQDSFGGRGVIREVCANPSPAGVPFTFARCSSPQPVR